MIKVPGEVPSKRASSDGCVYGRALGADVAMLHPDVASLHVGEASTRAEGSFEVTRRSGPIRGVIAWALRLPRSGQSVAVGLSIDRSATGERWERRFDGAALPLSLHRVVDRGRVEERVGPLALVLEVTVTPEGAMRMVGRRCALRLGPLTVPISASLSPRVDAVASAVGDHRVHISVRIVAPILGELLTYRGIVEPKEDDDAHRALAVDPARDRRRVRHALLPRVAGAPRR